MSDASLNELVNSINSPERKYPVVQAVKANPVLAAAIAKLVKPRDPRVADITNEDNYARQLPRSEFLNISSKISRNRKDNQTVLELFPETELAAQILISSIISPKDMTASKLHYKNEVSPLPPEINTTLSTIVADYIKEFYNLESELTDILREILFTNGCYINAVIPESMVDRIITGSNTAMESLQDIYDVNTKKIKSIGFLGDSAATSHSFESMFNRKDVAMTNETILNNSDLLTVTDNYDFLKIPLLLKKNVRSKIKDTIFNRKDSVSTEARDIHRNNNINIKEFLNYTLLKPNRRSVGKPLVMRLPPESVIPVHVPGDPKDHVGYFVILDGNGHPVIDKPEHYNDNSLEVHLNNNSNSMGSFLLEKARANLVEDDRQRPVKDIDKLFADIVESDLLGRLKNGVYSQDLELSRVEDVYRIMLARVLQSQYTKILYLPVEIVSYVAYKHHDNGIGKSLLDDLSVLNSLRAMTLFSRVIAGVKNSIGITQVKIKLDERDPDPQKSIEEAMSEIIKTRQQAFPLGINTANEIVDWVQRSGLEFTFEGHPKIPDMNFEFNQMGASHIKPDTELEEELDKRAIMALGLTPEIVDTGFSPEFATTVVANNVLLAKRVIRIQEIILPQLSNFIRMLLENDQDLLNELKEALIKNRETLADLIKTEYKVDVKDETVFDQIVLDYINNITVELPSPDSVDIVNQSASFDQYVDFIDKALDAWISSDLISSTVAGSVSENIDAVKVVVRSYFIRRWMSNNNVLPELNELTTVDNDGNGMIDLFEIQKTHLEGIMRSAIKFIDEMTLMKQAADSDVETLAPDEYSGGDYSSSGSSSSSDSSSDGGDGGDGGDDLSSDEDISGMSDGLDELGGEDAPTGDEVEETDDTAKEPETDKKE